MKAPMVTYEIQMLLPEVSAHNPGHWIRVSRFLSPMPVRVIIKTETHTKAFTLEVPGKKKGKK